MAIESDGVLSGNALLRSAENVWVRSFYLKNGKLPDAQTLHFIL